MSEAKALQVVSLLGSLRKGSFNAMLARTLPALAPADMKITAAPSVGDFPLYNADIQAEGFPAPVTAMAAAMAAADGVIIVTPEYNYSVPGVLKNAIDWVSRLFPQPFAGKPVALESASQSILGGARSQYHLRQTMVFVEAFVMNKPEVMVPSVQTKVDAAKGIITDGPTRDLIAAQLKAFAAFIRRVS